jgi:hypothetical protein
MGAGHESSCSNDVAYRQAFLGPTDLHDFLKARLLPGLLNGAGIFVQMRHLTSPLHPFCPARGWRSECHPGRGCIPRVCVLQWSLIPRRCGLHYRACSGTGRVPGRGVFRDGACSGTGRVPGRGVFRACSATGVFRGVFRDVPHIYSFCSNSSKPLSSAILSPRITD